MNEVTLRNKIESAKAEYLQRYGKLDWKWTDEGLPWTIQDYHGSVGSVMDFTEDDWLACRDNGLTLSEVLELCDEQYFDHANLVEYMAACLADWRERTGEYSAADEDIAMQDVLAYVQDFYTWRKEKLPMVQSVYEEK